MEGGALVSPIGGAMHRFIILISVICLLLVALAVGASAQLVFVNSALTLVCKDSLFWVDIRVDSMVDSIHTYVFLMYIDTTKVYFDSVSRGTILDPFGTNAWFDWDFDDSFPDSLYFYGSIFGAGTFVNGPGQLARIWLRTKREGITPVAFGRYLLLDPWHPSGPGMPVTLQDGQIMVLGPGLPFGDVNNDGAINVTDVVYLINHLFIDGPEPVPLWIIGDVNCDLKVNVSDVVYLINHLFINGPEPCDLCEE
jgi:hypothetical protein